MTRVTGLRFQRLSNIWNGCLAIGLLAIMYGHIGAVIMTIDLLSRMQLRFRAGVGKPFNRVIYLSLLEYGILAEERLIFASLQGLCRTRLKRLVKQLGSTS